MKRSLLFGTSALLLSAAAAAWAGVVTLARTTPVIADDTAREEALHKSSNGVYFHDHGYTDDGDRLLIGELPGEDYSRGGVYFFGSSETVTSLTPWTLPAGEQAFINNYAIGDLRHREVFYFIRTLVEEGGLLEAGGGKTTVALVLYYPLARDKDLSKPIDRYVELLFERHGLYTYDWSEGIWSSRISAVERFLRLRRDEANRFLQTWLTPRSRVITEPLSREWRLEHLAEVMGPRWQEIMLGELEYVEQTLDYLKSRDVRVIAVLPAMGSWHDELPYKAFYAEAIAPLLESRGIPVADFSGLLADDEFGDDVHARYAGQQKLHAAYRELALRELEAMGVKPAN